MTISPLNGSAHASAAARSGVQRQREDLRSVGCRGPAGDPPRSGAARGSGTRHRALTASRQQPGTALSRSEVRRSQVSLLSEQGALLGQAAAQTRQFGHHDELTGLPNRRLLLERYHQAVALAARRHRQVALLLLDRDGFKRINDTYGHATGDAILQQVAARLLGCIRTSDTACRYGGNEFVVLLPQHEGQESATAVGEKIRARLAAPYALDGTVIRVTVSIGMAVYPVDGQEYGDLMPVTDRAM